MRFPISRRATARLAVIAAIAPWIASAAADDPAAAVPSRVDAEARRIHEKVLVLDSHLDIPLDYGTGERDPARDGETQVDLPKLERGGVDAAVFAVYPRQRKRTSENLSRARDESDRKLAAIRAIAEKNPDRAALALTADDVEKIHRDKKVAIVIGVLNGFAIGKDLSLLDAYHRSGVRTFGFVHAGNNDLADSSRPSRDETPYEHGGLTALGREAVDRLNRLGVIVDVSQLSSQALFQVTSRTKAPVVATHSAIRSLVESPRNLSDEELFAIKKTGGVVQVVAFSYYLKSVPGGFGDKALAILDKYKKAGDELTEAQDEQWHKELHATIPRTATVVDLVDAIDYSVKKIGIDHVGISSDFNHGGGVIGWQDASEAPNVTRELVRRGYTEEQIAKLWGGNFLRVFREVESASRRFGESAAGDRDTKTPRR